MKTYHPSLSADSYKVGEKCLFLVVDKIEKVQNKYEFSHKKVVGTIIEKDSTYVLADVGYYTKKFVTNNGYPVCPPNHFTPFDELSAKISYDGIHEVSEGVTEVKEGISEVKRSRTKGGIREDVSLEEGISEVKQNRAKGGIKEVSDGGITEIKEDK